MKRLLVALAACLAVASCTTTDANVANHNLTQDADNFKVLRRITFINGITDKYLMTIEGYCSLDSSPLGAITVTCKVGEGYKRNYLGRSDNVTWISEQLTPQNVSPDHYKLVFKPETIIPDIEIR